jgi:hypothetical protein
MGKQNRLFGRSIRVSHVSRPSGGRPGARTQIKAIPAMNKTTISGACPKPLSPPVSSICVFLAETSAPWVHDDV